MGQGTVKSILRRRWFWFLLGVLVGVPITVVAEAAFCGVFIWRLGELPTEAVRQALK